MKIRSINNHQPSQLQTSFKAHIDPEFLKAAESLFKNGKRNKLQQQFHSAVKKVTEYPETEDVFIKYGKHSKGLYLRKNTNRDYCLYKDLFLPSETLFRDYSLEELVNNFIDGSKNTEVWLSRYKQKLDKIKDAFKKVGWDWNS